MLVIIHLTRTYTNYIYMLVIIHLTGTYTNYCTCIDEEVLFQMQNQTTAKSNRSKRNS